MSSSEQFKAKGRLWDRVRSIAFLFPAWFAPHKSLRVFFHRLRGVRIGKDVEIGYFCIIGNVHPSMVVIEDCAVIAARVTILEHDNSYFYTVGGKVKSAPVTVEAKAFIGVASVILPGVTIGAQAIVGCASVVNRDVPARTVVAGAPARIIENKHANPKAEQPDSSSMPPSESVQEYVSVNRE